MLNALQLVHDFVHQPYVMYTTFHGSKPCSLRFSHSSQRFCGYNVLPQWEGQWEDRKSSQLFRSKNSGCDSTTLPPVMCIPLSIVISKAWQIVLSLCQAGRFERAMRLKFQPLGIGELVNPKMTGPFQVGEASLNTFEYHLNFHQCTIECGVYVFHV